MNGQQEMVYLDYAATTPTDAAIVELMTRLLAADCDFGNPSSGHAAGRASVGLVELASEQLAALLGCSPQEIVWTSGATESDNLAIAGAARYRSDRGRHLVSMPTEHKAVTDIFAELQKRGFEVSWLAPQPSGLVDLAELQATIRDDTQLVSIMHVNNETGVIQDIDAIGTICRSRDVLFHVDAAQSVGKLPIDLSTAPVDLLSTTAHKLYGPNGVGALYIADRPGCHVEPLLFGGGQQGGIRPGTLAAPLIAAFGLTAEIAMRRLDDDLAHLRALNELMWSSIRDIDGLLRNGDADVTFPGILNVSVPDVDGESLLLALEPLCVATGSACNSLSTEPSGVLRALGRSDAEAQGAIRFSFGRPTTAAQLELAAASYRRAVSKLRELAPAAVA